mgnify:CR=1 FL=1
MLNDSNKERMKRKQESEKEHKILYPASGNVKLRGVKGNNGCKLIKRFSIWNDNFKVYSVNFGYTLVCIINVTIVSDRLNDIIINGRYRLYTSHFSLYIILCF